MGGNSLNRSSRWVIIGLVLASALLRLPFLDEQGVGFDEAYSMVVSKSSWDIVIAAALTSGVHPPLFYILHKIMLYLWGVSEFAQRFGAAGFGILAVPLIYRAGRRFFGTRTGLLAAALLALHPLHIWFSLNARMYSPFLTLGIACMLAFWWAIRSDRRAAWATLAVMHAVTFYVHYFSMLIPTVQFVFILLTFRRNHRYLRTWTLMQVLAGLAFLPWVVAIAARETMSFGIGYLVRPTLADLFLTAWNLTSVIAYSWWPLPVAALVVSLLLLANGARPVRERADAHLLVVLWAFLPPVVVWVISQRHSFYSDRFFVFVIPAFVLLMAFGLCRLPAAKWRALAMAAAVLASLPGMYAIRSESAYHKDEWREAAAYVCENERPGDVVLVYRMGMSFPFKYYFRGDAPVRDLSFNQVWFPIEELTAGHERAWLVYSYPRDATHSPRQPIKPSGYWREDPERNPAVAERFDAGYRNAAYRHFFGIEVWAVDLAGGR